jgi:hypothetical protein
LFLRQPTNWTGPTHIIEGDLLYGKSTDCTYAPHLKNTGQLNTGFILSQACLWCHMQV